MHAMSISHGYDMQHWELEGVGGRKQVVYRGVGLGGGGHCRRRMTGWGRPVCGFECFLSFSSSSIFCFLVVDLVVPCGGVF